MRTLSATILLSMTLSSEATGTESDKVGIVNMCRDGYQQSRAAIRSLACKVDINISASRSVNPYSGKIEESPAQIQRLVWTEDDSAARCTQSFEGQAITLEYHWSQGVLKHLKS